MLEVAEAAAAVEEDADDVEADRAVGRDGGRVGEPGAGEAAEAALLGRADGEDRARRAA